MTHTNIARRSDIFTSLHLYIFTDRTVSKIFYPGETMPEKCCLRHFSGFMFLNINKKEFFV